MKLEKGPQAVMPRSDHFATEREPLAKLQSLQLQHARGPVGFLNPTQARYDYSHNDKGGSEDDAIGEEPSGRSSKHKQYGSGIGYHWTSRNNRKGRHQLVVTPVSDNAPAKFEVPESSTSPRHILKVIGRMFIYYPVWDVSWLVAFIFTWGSIVWVINAFFVFLPLVRPSTEFDNEIVTGGGVTAFIGATIFEVGSLFLMLEAVNENRAGDFGWAVRAAYEGHSHEERTSNGNGHGTSASADAEKAGLLQVTPGGCSHHHPNRKNLVGKPNSHLARTAAGVREVDPKGDTGWVWFPSWYDLKTHYFHELGFIACLAQLFGASIFWISGFTALPDILNKLSPGLEDGIYWTPQILGGSGFIVSGILFMLETQPKWYLPAPKVLGWWIGGWNLIGGVGFTLCPAFGYDTSSWAQYQASLSTFWGSFAFLIGSVVQLYESLEKNPVEVEKVPTDATTSQQAGKPEAT